MYEAKKERQKTIAVFPIEKGKHYKKILFFLQNNMSSVSSGLIKGAKDNKLDLRIAHEDDISREIHRLLNDRLRDASSDYTFTFEAKSGPDILIYASPYSAFSQELLVIEAKRLPPTSSQEYVKGDRGGIERFKKKKHGEKHDVAVILGYVQKNSFNHWYTKVNSWIDDLISDSTQNPRWEKQDRLVKIKISDIAEYRSKHSRISRKPITLHHFWINLFTYQLSFDFL